MISVFIGEGGSGGALALGGGRQGDNAGEQRLFHTVAGRALPASLWKDPSRWEEMLVSLMKITAAGSESYGHMRQDTPGARRRGAGRQDCSLQGRCAASLIKSSMRSLERESGVISSPKRRYRRLRNMGKINSTRGRRTSDKLAGIRDNRSRAVLQGR